MWLNSFRFYEWFWFAYRQTPFSDPIFHRPATGLFINHKNRRKIHVITYKAPLFIHHSNWFLVWLAKSHKLKEPKINFTRAWMEKKWKETCRPTSRVLRAEVQSFLNFWCYVCSRICICVCVCECVLSARNWKNEANIQIHRVLIKWHRNSLN